VPDDTIPAAPGSGLIRAPWTNEQVAGLERLADSKGFEAYNPPQYELGGTPVGTNEMAEGDPAPDGDGQAAAERLHRIRQAWVAADDLIRRMADLDMNGARVQQILGGKQRPTSLDMALIAIACQVSVSWLIDGTEPRYIGPISNDWEDCGRTTPRTSGRTETGPATASAQASGDAAGGNPADNEADSGGLREAIAGALREWHGDWTKTTFAEAADAVLAVVQPHLDRLAAEQERYEEETVGDFNQQAINLARRAGQAEAALAEARVTNRRLNHRAQTAESRLGAVATAVADWEIDDQHTYVPLRTLNAIAKAVGVTVDTSRWQLHYQRVEELEARLRDADARAVAADLARRTTHAAAVAAGRRAQEAEARVAAVRALHQPVTDRTGWTRSDYDTVNPACSACGSEDNAVPWPCPTTRALTQPARADGGEQR
jgi:hypothetical protein